MPPGKVPRVGRADAEASVVGFGHRAETDEVAEVLRWPSVRPEGTPGTGHNLSGAAGHYVGALGEVDFSDLRVPGLRRSYYLRAVPAGSR